IISRFQRNLGYSKRFDIQNLVKHIKFSPIYRKLYLGIAERTLFFTDKVMRKDPNKWLFTSWGRYSNHTLDNPRAVYERVKNDPEIKKVVILNSNAEVDFDAQSNTYFYPLHSLRAMHAMVTSGYIFTGYGMHAVFGYRHLVVGTKRHIIQLWHGIPIKKIGLAVDKKLEPFWSVEAHKYSKVIANSIDDKKMMALSFLPERPEDVIMSGLPRHDFIGLDSHNLPLDYQQHLMNIQERVNGRKLILFTPTWRYNNEKPCIFSTDEFSILDALLKEKNAVLGVRLHANMMRGNNYASFVSDNVIYFNDVPDVNLLLREASALITDYSSIYLDYMTLERPVLLYTPDIEKYRNHRGFNYSSEEFMPHDFCVLNFTLLKEKILQILNDEFVLDESYFHVKRKFLGFELDNKNAQRVIENL
ncbi:CDP-glycerol glycerophosphotransferase family protein, partial [Photobacterium japonica]|uniref:CDP-glycerol glycerophosphotransferase family protein n=1 Tax=Photobacterium japonica TaxID=2910235 RepID=UPI003D0DD34F